MYARVFVFWLLLFALFPGPAAWAQQTAPLNPAAPPLQSAPPALPPDTARRTPVSAPVLRPARPVVLRLLLEDTDRALLRPYRYRTVLPDSLAALREVRQLVLALQSDAYLTASADEARWSHDTLQVQFYIGEKFRWARLRNGNLGDGLLTRAGYREKLFRQQPFQPQEWGRLQDRILHEAENQGYPFATVGLDSVALRGADVEGRIVLRRGPAVVFDSLQIVGKTKTRARFLTKYLQIEPNQPFSQQRIQEAARRLRQLPYLQLKAEPEVRFAQGRARVYFLLEDRTSNQFDAIVGVLPNPNPGIGQKRIQITGDVTINLRNISGGGKGVGVQWRKLNANSQLLDAQYVHPAFFGTPLELDGSFNLLKQDTLFLTSRPRLQVAYPLAQAGRLSFFIDWRNSRLLSADSSLRQLPANIDSRFTSYGLEYTWNTLDDPYFPRRGLLATGQGSFGTKRISKNASLNDALYNGLALRSTQVSLGIRVEQYFRVGRSGVLMARLRGEGLINERLFLNDLFRVGGLATLRGFNELNYYASQYAVGTAEFRQFTGADAYVFLFVDQGYLRRDLPDAPIPHDTPTGLGAGLSFRTGAGQFQFVYALGRDQQQKFALNSGKIHFGITSRF
ncbi:hypothetical protein DNI29_01160 [Hymenobacter sediminis]|uniref:BamA/TamA family outer membrane protein n=1 Tax=Hymenobacter sediminis TaxID=2218621 RepID=UPI000DA668D4|nr:BamA/TamA family outer membrane protein [Hymenobacter sediminis]RPD49441.1 hypothetical protein DNI29_01160 [Hymenobacter sediminis]